MAKLEITVRNKTNHSLVAHEKFEISLELAQELIKRMEAMVAKLPGHHRATRTVRPGGTTIVEIELNRDLPPPIVQPDFYADVMVYLSPGVRTRLLRPTWTTIYSHVAGVISARHNLGSDEIIVMASDQPVRLTAGEESQLLELRQEIRQAVVRLARQREITWPRPGSDICASPNSARLPIARCKRLLPKG